MSDNNIWNIITYNYDHEEIIDWRCLLQRMKQYEKTQLDVYFLTVCKQNNIIPKSLHFRLWSKDMVNDPDIIKF